MTIKSTRAQRRLLNRDNSKQPSTLHEVPRALWPDQDGGHIRVLRSLDFLVQEFPSSGEAVVRLSVCRAVIIGNDWQDRITWDELQQIKRECGYGDDYAIEIFPPDADVVNVANMRHLWIMAEPLSCAWKKRR